MRDLLSVLVEGCRGAVRLRVEGRSAARGTPPGWLEAASRFEVTGLTAGSAVVELEAPPLWEAAPERFQQTELFKSFDASTSCLALFEESLAEAAGGREDTDGYDPGLLRTFAGLSRLFAEGVESLEIAGSHRRAPALVVGREGIAHVERLVRLTPPPQSVRLAGRIDTIRHSDRMFTLVLESGEVVRGVAEGVDPAVLAGLFGRDVVAAGTAVFRPSSSLLRLDAESIEPAHGDTSIWSRAPRPRLADLDARSFQVPQGPRSGVAAIIGRWPGDESDDEIKVFLRDLS